MWLLKTRMMKEMSVFVVQMDWQNVSHFQTSWRANLRHGGNTTVRRCNDSR